MAKNETTAIAIKEEPKVDPVDLSQGCYVSKRSFDEAMGIASHIAKSNMIPAGFVGNPDNCVIALEMANRLRMSPLMVMQNMAIVHGKPSLSAQLLIATFNNCGKYTSIKYKFVGTPGTDSYGCIAYATELATGEVVESDCITLGMARQEGWLTKNGSKWRTMPGQMLRYRSASFLVRTTAPELGLGYYTPEEAEDIAANLNAGRTYVTPSNVVSEPPEPASHRLAMALKNQVATPTPPVQPEKEIVIDAPQVSLGTVNGEKVVGSFINENGIEEPLFDN